MGIHKDQTGPIKVSTTKSPVTARTLLTMIFVGLTARVILIPSRDTFTLIDPTSDTSPGRRQDYAVRTQEKLINRSCQLRPIGPNLWNPRKGFDIKAQKKIAFCAFPIVVTFACYQQNLHRKNPRRSSLLQPCPTRSIILSPVTPERPKLTHNKLEPSVRMVTSSSKVVPARFSSQKFLHFKPLFLLDLLFIRVSLFMFLLPPRWDLI